jgi:predicted N-acyltransferase
VLEQGIEFRTLRGDELSEALIERVFRLHENTFIRHGHTPYLNRAFFVRVARSLAASFFVKLAMRAGEAVAVAVFFRSADTLYGRYWGADADYHSLHFEACYYQGIDYCIATASPPSSPAPRASTRSRAASSRRLTWSAHWIADLPLRRAIGAYLAREGQAIDAYASEADAHAPFRKGEPTPTPR